MSVAGLFLVVFAFIHSAFSRRVNMDEVVPELKRNFAGVGDSISNNAENFKHIHEFLDLVGEVKTHIEKNGGGTVVCEAGRIRSAGVAELTVMSKKHRQDQGGLLREVASEMLNIIIAGLGAAADAGVPGVGAALAVAARAAAMESEVAGLFADSVRHAGGDAMKALRLDTLEADLFNVASNLVGNASIGSDGEGVLQNGLETAHVEVHEEATRSILKSLLSGRSVKEAVKEFGDTMSAAFPEAAKSGLREAAWSAAEFIPIFGPFVAAARQITLLVDATKTLVQSQKEYFARKDPILRSVFRSRDCMLVSFLRADAESIARNSEEIMDARIEALFETMESLHSAITLNHDLLSRLKKTTKRNPMSAIAHEDAVMSRLTIPLSDTTQSNTTNGDSGLSPEVLKPSDWQALVDESVLRNITSSMASLAHQRMVFRCKHGVACRQRFHSFIDAELRAGSRRYSEIMEPYSGPETVF